MELDRLFSLALKKDESAFDTRTEVPKETPNLFDRRNFKEEEESFPGGDGVTRPEGNLDLRVKSLWEEGG